MSLQISPNPQVAGTVIKVLPKQRQAQEIQFFFHMICGMEGS
jgi:hypothetical protein